MRTHVHGSSNSPCFAKFGRFDGPYRPRRFRRTLVVALVLNRLDYANSTLAGLPTYLFRRLQSVLNASAPLIYGLSQHAHITDALISLHWLRVPERVKFKISCLENTGFFVKQCLSTLGTRDLHASCHIFLVVVP